MKNEFEFIETIRRKYNLTKIGDDCAVLPKDSKTDLVITTDLLVEDIDFKLEWSKPEFIGHKALAVSLSDVAAMGAKPVWAMLSIGVPETVWKTDFVEKLYDGYTRLANKFNVELVGGDVSRTPDKVVIDSIVAGEVKKGKAVLRSGAKVGDLIYVTDELGGAAGGLRLLENGFLYDVSEKNWRKRLLLKQLQPFPQISSGEYLNANNLATSMIDLSDGLSSDLAHVCRASNVGAKIFTDKIPFDKKLKPLAESFAQKIDFALHGGEDFELLFTANPKKKIRLKKEYEKRGFSCIGEITANSAMIELISGEKSQILQPKGFRHF
jgi:thiamine-monophosphate kinase